MTLVEIGLAALLVCVGWAGCHYRFRVIALAEPTLRAVKELDGEATFSAVADLLEEWGKTTSLVQTYGSLQRLERTGLIRHYQIGASSRWRVASLQEEPTV